MFDAAVTVSRSAMTTIRRLWREDIAAIDVAVLILLVTILGLGTIAGLAVLRNQIVQEFGDVGVALESLDQSYDVVVEVNGSVVYEAHYTDSIPAYATDPAGGAPYGIEINKTGVTPPANNELP
jgi:Flp pilus assembly pilin Flp